MATNKTLKNLKLENKMRITKINDYLNDGCGTWTVGIEGKIEEVEKMIKMLSEAGYGQELDGGDGERDGILRTAFGILEDDADEMTKAKWEKNLRREYKEFKKQL